MAAELIDAGVDVHEIYRRLYEGIPYGKLELLARALSNVERYDEGRLTITRLSAAGLRGDRRRGELLRGCRRSPALRPRHRGRGAGPRPASGTARRAAARSRCAPPNERVDVSAIARAQGGGGHRQAAGFSTSMEWPELIAFLRREIAAQL